MATNGSVVPSPEPANGTPQASDCPAIGPDAVSQALTAAGISMTLDDWSSLALPPDVVDTAPAPAVSPVARMYCAGDEDKRTATPMPVFGPGAQMTVSSFEDADAVVEYVTSKAIVVSPEPQTISGQLAVASCVDLGPALRSCDSRWWQDSVMITLSVAGNPAQVEAATVDQALVALVPMVVDHLAA